MTLDDFTIEHQIVRGLVQSTDYIKRTRPYWKKEWRLKDPELRIIARWCLAYYDKYGRAPDQDNHVSS
jgi:hypothetical protein